MTNKATTSWGIGALWGLKEGEKGYCGPLACWIGWDQAWPRTTIWALAPQQGVNLWGVGAAGAAVVHGDGHLGLGGFHALRLLRTRDYGERAPL
jgi:hypothetical protein